MAFMRDELALERVSLEIRAEIGSASLKVGNLLQIGRGAVIQLHKSVDGEVDLMVEHHLVARGNFITEEDHFAVRVTKTSVDIHE